MRHPDPVDRNNLAASVSRQKSEGRRQRARYRSSLVLLLLLLPALAQAVSTSCLVCGKDPAPGHAHVTYRGTDYPACDGGCDIAFAAADRAGTLDQIVRKLEPRSALFQGDSKFLNPVYQQANPMSEHWMHAGLWVLLAIVSAGVSGFIALTTHRPVICAFVVGFVLPLLGPLITLALPKRPEGFALRGNKIPTTYDVVSCPACGRSLHPSASTCPACAAAQSPKIQSDVQRIQHQENHRDVQTN